jgi:RNA polymerase sigma factor (sigma-70 family)
VGGNVATTEWSQVLTARDGSDTEARQALERLCQTYWQPLYAFVRHQGAAPDEARDLTQGYFAELLEKDFLSAVDPSKGRFRAFLLASMRHYLSHQRDRDRAQKRGGKATTLPLDIDSGERAYKLEVADNLTPEDLYEVQWAMTVLHRAFSRLESEAGTQGNSNRLQHLQPYLTSSDEEIPYRQTAELLGMTESGVKSAVRRLRQHLGTCLRAEIAETVADPAEVDDEVRFLLSKVKF